MFLLIFSFLFLIVLGIFQKKYERIVLFISTFQKNQFPYSKLIMIKEKYTFASLYEKEKNKRKNKLVFFILIHRDIKAFKYLVAIANTIFF